MKAVVSKSCKKIITEVNNYTKKKQSLRLDANAFENVLLQTNVNIAVKKKKLINCLHELLLKTLSINPISVNKKTFEHIKIRLAVTREIIQKLISINHYFTETVLHELGLIKKPFLLIVLSSKNPAEKLKSRKNFVSSTHVKQLENTVYQLMNEIVLFDNKLIEKCQDTQSKTSTSEKLELNDLEATLHRQTEYLEILEEKIPPPSRITRRLFQKQIFNDWVPMLFGILAHIEEEYKQELQICVNIKKVKKFHTIINKKIKHIIKEKEHMLHLQEKRAFEMDNFKKVQEDYRQVFHQYIGASSL